MMLNRKQAVVTVNHQVREELRALGLTQEFVANVARQSSSAKVDAMAIDPLSTPGQFAYIYGVRSIRYQLLPLGWRISRSGNVESTVNDELGIQLCFQNVDVACAEQNPNAISGKGSGSRKLIQEGQHELFARNDGAPKQDLGVTPRVWVLCVSTEDKRLRAEVSCPEIFEGNQFEGFSKRIFVVDEEFSPIPGIDKNTNELADTPEYEVRIAKK
jgi:hypothetical protein